MTMLLGMLAVMTGGALGALGRYGLGLWWNRQKVASALPLPTGIVVVNAIGCLLLGLAAGYLVTGTEGASEGYRLLVLGITTGFCGSLTTFSTFSMETIMLWKRAQRKAAIGYVLLTLTSSFLSFALGFGIAV